jgi:hypothetical protein
VVVKFFAVFYEYIQMKDIDRFFYRRSGQTLEGRVYMPRLIMKPLYLLSTVNYVVLLSSIAWLVHMLDNPFKFSCAFLFMVHMKLLMLIYSLFC